MGKTMTWLRWLGQVEDKHIQYAHKYKVDEYSENKLVYEFNGFFYHGSPQCLNPNTIHPKITVLMHELYRGKTGKDKNTSIRKKIDGIVLHRNVGV